MKTVRQTGTWKVRWFLPVFAVLLSSCLPNGRELSRTAADGSVQRYFTLMEYVAEPRPGEVAPGTIVRLFPRADRAEYWRLLMPGQKWEMKEIDLTNGKTTLEFMNEGDVWRKVECKPESDGRQPFLCGEILKSGVLAFRFVGVYDVVVSWRRQENRKVESDWRELAYRIETPAAPATPAP